jgi:hypothetical protein
MKKNVALKMNRRIAKINSLIIIEMGLIPKNTIMDMDLGIIMIIIPMVNNHMDTKEFVLNIILCYSFYNLSFIYNSHFLFINFNIIIIN